jgi:hypothetical protein
VELTGCRTTHCGIGFARFETLADANLHDQKTAVEVWWALERDTLGRSVATAADRTPGG